MTSTRRSHALSHLNTHPNESRLLAYLREQPFETRASVMQHVEQEQCPVCLKRLGELEQVTHVLDLLGAMPSYHSYPELTVEDIGARLQGAARPPTSAEAARRHGKYPGRASTSAVRLISLPVAFGMAALFTVAMLVFAGLSGKTFLPLSSGATRQAQHVLNVTVPSQSIPTSQTAAVKEPAMQICSGASDLAQLRLRVCGFHFDSAHKVNLALSVHGNKTLWMRGIHVRKDGTFQVAWTIHGCRYMPASISAYQVTGSKPIEALLSIPSFGACTA